MTKLTQERIAKLAMDIYNWLKEREMDDAICIYYGNKRINTYEGKMQIDEGVWASDYCELAPYNNIITISSEGNLYDWYNLTYEMPASLKKIWEKEGLSCECNQSWNWSLYPLSQDLEVEYPAREAAPPKPTYICLGCKKRSAVEYPSELDTVMQLWFALGQTIGEVGACVIGEHMDFKYKGVFYEMAPITGFQSEYSWSKWVDLIKEVLSNLGATHISWNCGRLD